MSAEQTMLSRRLWSGSRLLLLILLVSVIGAILLLYGIGASNLPTIIKPGFYPQEHKAGIDAQFAAPRAALLIQGTQGSPLLRLRVRSPDPLPARQLRLERLGQPLATIDIDQTPRTLYLLPPPEEQPGIGSLLELTTDAAQAPGDPRALGLMYDVISVTPLNSPWPRWLRWFALLSVLGVAIWAGYRLWPQLKRASQVHMVAGLALLGVLLVFFWPVLWRGDILSAADMIFERAAFHAYAPEGFTQPSNAILSDQPYQFIPWRKIAWESLREGRLPLWDPQSLAGRSYLGTQQAALFYPINLLLTLVPFAQTFLLSALIRLWLAGFGVASGVLQIPARIEDNARRC